MQLVRLHVVQTEFDVKAALLVFNVFVGPWSVGYFPKIFNSVLDLLGWWLIKTISSGP